MRPKSFPLAYLTIGVFLVLAMLFLLLGSAALAQEGACGTIDPDPPTEPPPDPVPALPTYCFGPNGPGPDVRTDDGCILDVFVVYTPLARDGRAAKGNNDKHCHW